jgi:hypothetical protein
MDLPTQIEFAIKRNYHLIVECRSIIQKKRPATERLGAQRLVIKSLKQMLMDGTNNACQIPSIIHCRASDCALILTHESIRCTHARRDITLPG